MKGLVLLLGLCLAAAAAVAGVTVDGARFHPGPEATRLELRLSGSPELHSFHLTAPARFVVDLKNARLGARFPRRRFTSEHVRAVRYGVRAGADLRVVVDLEDSAFGRARLLAVQDPGPARLVIEVARPAAGARPAAVLPPPAPPPPPELVVAVDAGHGGKDPGAIGPRGTREKDITLAIALQLSDLIDREPGMRAVLTRDDDRYLMLADRVELARRARAGLFVSLHADASTNRDARGASVYVLSTGRASSEAARRLASRENRADLVGGAALADKDDAVAHTVLEFVQGTAWGLSLELAGEVLARLGELGPLHKPRVEHAGFVVLTAPDIPSILVETAFLSNRREEAKLRDSRAQAALAAAILDGIRAFAGAHRRTPEVLIAAKEMPAMMPAIDLYSVARPAGAAAGAGPAGVPPAARVHVTERGETLRQIADHYRISLPVLLSENGLETNRLRVPAGSRLRIPAGS